MKKDLPIVRTMVCYIRNQWGRFTVARSFRLGVVILLYLLDGAVVIDENESFFVVWVIVALGSWIPRT